MKLLDELRRRNVIRVAALYLVGAWLVVQVAETLLPIFDTPVWVLKALVVLLALGLAPALVFAWVFELTPAGLKRQAEVDLSQGNVDHTARRLDVAVILLLVGVGAMTLWQWRSSPEPAPPPVPAAAKSTPEPASNTAIVDKSIAVLPFADFSPGGDQGWFADGLTEEVLNALARTPDLLVSARTSSFRYKGSDLAIPQIAKELGVAHVLEGSVRSTPERIRVTAQLIRADDGFHLWSQTYDRDVADMIEIQEDLARQIAIAMQTSMDPAALAEMAAAGTRSVEAYQAYIRGLSGIEAFDEQRYRDAYALFERARELDPAFAAAHLRAAMFWLVQLDPTSTANGLTEATTAQAGERFRERIDLAIRHATSEAERASYQALKAARELRLRDAASMLETAFAQRPGNTDVIANLVTVAVQASDEALLRRTLDAIWPQAQTRLEVALTHIDNAHRAADKRRAADEALVLLQRWPDNGNVLYQAHRALLWDGRVEEAAGVLARWLAVQGEAARFSPIPRMRQACAEGSRAEVEAELARTAQDDIVVRWHLMSLLGMSADAAAVLQPLERAGNTFGLAGFLAYPEFDPTPFPSLMAVLEREQVKRPPPLVPPFACPPAAAAP